MTVEISLQYELTPLPLSLFSNKDQKMNKAKKADFSKTSLKALTDPLDLTNQPCRHPGDWWWMASLHGEVVTTADLAGGRKQFTWTMCIIWAATPRRSLWSLMATADHQKIMTTSGVPRTPAVISTFDLIWFTGPQEQSSWITLVTSVSSSTSSLLPSENITSLWSRVTMMLTLRLWERHWLLLQIAVLRSVTFVSVFSYY